VNAENVRKIKNAQRKTVTIKKTKNVRMTVILNVSANGNSTLPNREEKTANKQERKSGRWIVTASPPPFNNKPI